MYSVWIGGSILASRKTFQETGVTRREDTEDEVKAAIEHAIWNLYEPMRRDAARNTRIH